MPISNDQHVVRICNSSAVDKPTRKPTLAAFAFRQSEDGTWKDSYLSVFWLEFLHPGAGTGPEQLAAFRAYANSDPPFGVPRFSRHGALARLPVGAIHLATKNTAATTLECVHEPRGARDGHSGLHPIPGVDHWPTIGDAPEHLALQQFLWQAMSDWEDTFPT